ncbi:TetR/AcrR family transcriptional regulator [Corynebacterium sp. LK2510]|uniref:TetR/AcrR family transcriptional regulator n=1 Tax=Corynebacterium sp. LK2510 TaxID=3110472 RepID=UPI0034CDDC60
MPIVPDTELARRRREILDAARACFAQYGYEGATVSRLEQATGKTRGAIFHHFGDKESLFLAVAREDADKQADVVAESGLIGLMRSLLAQPDSHSWHVTRAEIMRKLRTDPSFAERWREQLEVLDDALSTRLERNPAMRDDVPVDVIRTYLATMMEGLVVKIASGESTEHLSAMLDFVEQSVRNRVPKQ